MHIKSALLSSISEIRAARIPRLGNAIAVIRILETWWTSQRTVIHSGQAGAKEAVKSCVQAAPLAIAAHHAFSSDTLHDGL